MMDFHEDAITDGTEFNAALRSLIGRARENGVRVEGGWDCRFEEDDPDVEVLITRLSKPPDLDPDVTG